MPNFWLFQTAFVLELIAVALFAGYAVRPIKNFSVAASLALGMAAAFQILFTLLLALNNDRLPLGNAFEALNFWSLSFALLALRLEWRYQMGLLGAFLAPLAALLLLMGIRFSHVVPPEELPVSSFFLFLHVALPMAGYALFTASAAVAAAWFIEERQIRRLYLGQNYALPALEVLEQLSKRLAAWGWLGLSIGLLAGFLGYREQFVVHLGSDPKVAMSFLTWLFYGVSLLLARGGLRGKTLASLLSFGFLALFLSYYLVNVFWGGHGFQGGH